MVQEPRFRGLLPYHQDLGELGVGGGGAVFSNDLGQLRVRSVSVCTGPTVVVRTF